MKIVYGLHINGRATINGVSLPNMSSDSIPIFSDKDGRLWSEHISEFSTETLKLLVLDDNRIASYAYDVTEIGLPNEESIMVEVSTEEIPPNFFDHKMFTNWAWTLDKGIHVRVPSDDELTHINTKKKKDLTNDVLNEIVKLQVLEKYNAMSSTDEVRLKKLELALIDLTRINVTDLDINWPDLD